MQPFFDVKTKCATAELFIIKLYLIGKLGHHHDNQDQLDKKMDKYAFCQLHCVKIGLDIMILIYQYGIFHKPLTSMYKGSITLTNWYTSQAEGS